MKLLNDWVADFDEEAVLQILLTGLHLLHEMILHSLVCLYEMDWE